MRSRGQCIFSTSADDKTRQQSNFITMAKRSETNRSDANDDGDDSGKSAVATARRTVATTAMPTRAPADAGTNERTVLRTRRSRDAIVHLKDRNGSSVQDIRRYLTVEFDRFKNVPVVDLEVDVRKAASRSSKRHHRQQQRALLTGWLKLRGAARSRSSTTSKEPSAQGRMQGPARGTALTAAGSKEVLPSAKALQSEQTPI
ncbi:hypothetical protein Btru_073990 [Bulinus truncatus]|nr:hypothetical protein Btru_073990 [Bulinus truncatus]